MRYKAIVDENGAVVWVNGEPKAKEIGVSTLVGLPFSDFRKEYLAHYDKYAGNREANIKWCEMNWRISRHDPRPHNVRRKKIMVSV